jgi:lysine 2,3-aminomutase
MTCPTRSGTTGAGSCRTAVNDLEEIERILELTDEEREGLSATDKFRVDITPYFISLIDPRTRTIPIRRQVIPTGREHGSVHGDDGGLARRGPPLAGAGPRHRYPDRVLMLVDHAVRVLLPLLHPVAHRR